MGHDSGRRIHSDSVPRQVLGSTASLTSSIMKSRQEYGRTYHRYKEGSQWPYAIIPSVNQIPK